jgi:hypothetical protein
MPSKWGFGHPGKELQTLFGGHKSRAGSPGQPYGYSTSAPSRSRTATFYGERSHEAVLATECGQARCVRKKAAEGARNADDSVQGLHMLLNRRTGDYQAPFADKEATSQLLSMASPAVSILTKSKIRGTRINGILTLTHRYLEAVRGRPHVDMAESPQVVTTSGATMPT